MSADFGSTRMVKARKSHECEECGRAIERGERYERHAGSWEGDFFTCVSCPHCAAFRSMICDVDVDFWEGCYHGIGEWVANDLHREYITGTLTVDLELWRAVRDFRRRWTADGVLLPVPGFELQAAA